MIDLVKEMGVTTVRYPEGHLVSGFRWEVSVGPRGDRPVRLNHAWHTTETNEALRRPDVVLGNEMNGRWLGQLSAEDHRQDRARLRPDARAEVADGALRVTLPPVSGRAVSLR